MFYTSATVETLLNLVWLLLSAGLVTVCVRSFARGRGRIGWTAIIALGLLVVLLFPAISMTDDRVAMQSAAVLEHDSYRPELLAHHVADTALPWLVALLCCAICLVAATLLRVLAAVPHRAARVLLMGRVPTWGIRGPSRGQTLLPAL